MAMILLLSGIITLVISEIKDNKESDGIGNLKIVGPLLTAVGLALLIVSSAIHKWGENRCDAIYKMCRYPVIDNDEGRAATANGRMDRNMGPNQGLQSPQLGLGATCVRQGPYFIPRPVGGCSRGVHGRVEEYPCHMYMNQCSCRLQHLYELGLEGVPQTPPSYEEAMKLQTLKVESGSSSSLSTQTRPHRDSESHETHSVVVRGDTNSTILSGDGTVINVPILPAVHPPPTYEQSHSTDRTLSHT